MAKALSVLKKEYWTLPAEEGEPNPTEWLIRPLCGVEKFDVEIWFDRDNRPHMSERSGRAVLGHGLLGWRNFPDEQGELVPFNDKDFEENLKRLDLGVAAQVATEIWTRSTLTEEQRLNLSSPPTSVTTGSNSGAQVADSDGTATNEIERLSSSG